MHPHAQQHDLPPHASVHEVAVHITPARVNANDRGLVVVGFSLRLGDLAAECTHTHALVSLLWCPARIGLACTLLLVHPVTMATTVHASPTTVEEAAFPLHADGEPLANQQGRRLLAEQGEVQGHARGAGGAFLHGIDLSRHFSYFAYEGGSGQWRWNHEVVGGKTGGSHVHQRGAVCVHSIIIMKGSIPSEAHRRSWACAALHRRVACMPPTTHAHQGTDFHKDMDAAANRLTPQHNYRLTAEEMAGRHFGELSCREFRDSVLRSLPHSWTRRSDTRIVARQFVRNTVANRKSPGGRGEREPGNAVARAVARVAQAAGRGGRGERKLEHVQGHRLVWLVRSAFDTRGLLRGVACVVADVL